MAWLAAIGMDCPRIVLANQTITNVSALWTHVAVIPRNGSWDGPGNSVYGFDLWVSNQTVRDALTRAGASASLGTLRRHVTSVGSASHEVWDFRSGDAALSLTAPRDSEPSGSAGSRHAHFFYGSNPFARIDVQYRDEATETFDITGGHLRMSGSVRLRSVIGADDALGAGGSHYSKNWDIDLAAKWFEN
jgi:hypothetical protein